MKYRFSAWYFKLIAFVLAVLCLGVGFFSGILTLWMGEQGHYDTDSYWSSWAARRAVQWETHQIHSYMDPGWSSDGPHTDFSKLPEFLEDGDLRYILLNEDGSLVTFYLDGLKLQTKGLNFAKNDFSLAIQSSSSIGPGHRPDPGRKGFPL